MHHDLRNRTNLGLLTLIGVATLSVVTLAQPQETVSVVTVYTGANFGGQNASFSDDMATLAPAGLNNNIASIKIAEGEKWEVCQEANYVGRCQMLSGSATDLAAIGWSGQISSLRRADPGAFALT